MDPARHARPCGASVADLPEAGVKSRAFQGDVSYIWQIMAVLCRYGFQLMTILGQRSDSRRPIGRLRRMPFSPTLRVGNFDPEGLRLLPLG